MLDQSEAFKLVKRFFGTSFARSQKKFVKELNLLLANGSGNTTRPKIIDTTGSVVPETVSGQSLGTPVVTPTQQSVPLVSPEPQKELTDDLEEIQEIKVQEGGEGSTINESGLDDQREVVECNDEPIDLGGTEQTT